MNMHQLSPEEHSEVLRRAQEIDNHTHDQVGVEDYVKAAEEAGISREAVLMALRERLGVPLTMPTVGEMVFAKSADGHYYAATISSIEEKDMKVRFVNGSDSRITTVDLREFNLSPGQKVNYQSSGMWWDAEIVRYNAEGRSVTVNIWGSEETVSLEKIRIRKPTSFELNKSLNAWIARAAIFLSGSGIGIILYRILTKG